MPMPDNFTYQEESTVAQYGLIRLSAGADLYRALSCKAVLYFCPGGLPLLDCSSLFVHATVVYTFYLVVYNNM
jgi:hypothetical protein